MSAVLKRLREIQAEMGLVDAHFADRLGIDRAVWHNYKFGKRSVGKHLIKAALRTFPNDAALQRAVLEELSQPDATSSPAAAAAV
jgi:transcriptional regulator with XRE-family HTH domain